MHSDIQCTINMNIRTDLAVEAHELTRGEAQEIDGVGSVIVVSEWEGAGTGTVKLIVMDMNGAPATHTILRLWFWFFVHKLLEMQLTFPVHDLLCHNMS